MIKPTYVTFFTNRTPYADLRSAWRTSIAKHAGADQSIEYGYENTKSWEKNTNYKAEAIYSALEDTAGDVIYIDIDAKLCKPATYFTSLPKHIDISIPVIREDKTILTGTMFFRNNPKVREFVSLWLSICNDNPEIPDQFNFHKALGEFSKKKKLNIDLMPPELCYVDTLANKYDSMNPGDKEIVIKHAQASRKYRNEINSGKKPRFEHKGK